MTLPLFPTPGNWSWTSLGEIADVVGGVPRDSKKQADESLPEVPYLRVANVQRDHLDLRTVTRIRVPENTIEKLRLRRGDVLLNEGGDRDKLGRGWIWDGQIEGCIHQNHVFRARLHPETLHPKLLAWYANELARQWFDRNATQSVNLASISISKVKSLPVPVPPYDLQQEMVEVIEANLSHVDTVARGIQASIRRLRALKKRTIVDAVPVPGPEHWATVTVEDAGSVELGCQRHPDWHSGPNMRPYLRVANVFEDRIDVSDLMEMDFPPGVFDRFRLIKGDILLNEGQSPELLGRPAMYKGEPPEVAYTNSLIRFRARDGVSPEWALLVFRRHMHAGRFARDAQITTNIAHLSAGRFKKVEFPVPPPAEQDEIVARATGRLTAIEWLVQTLEAAQLKTAAARRRLLAEAFTGRLVLRDRGAIPAQPAAEGRGSENVVAGTGEA